MHFAKQLRLKLPLGPFRLGCSWETGRKGAEKQREGTKWWLLAVLPGTC